MTSRDPDDVASEIETLAAARRRFGRGYFTLLPAVFAGALVVFAWTAERGNGVALALAAVCGLWALGTALGWIPAPDPPRGWWGGERRLDSLREQLPSAAPPTAAGALRRVEWDRLYARFCNQVLQREYRERLWRRERPREPGALRTLEELEAPSVVPDGGDLDALKRLVAEYARSR